MTNALGSVRQTSRMIEEDPGPVVQRLILGEELRQRREAAGIGLDDANDDLGWYRGKLSKIENGNLALKERELARLLKRYGVTGPDAERVRKLGGEARRKAAPERVSDWAKQYVALERAATEIRMVYPEIPGMLQTRECAHAQLSRSPVVSGADIDGMADAREQRGDRLYREHAPNVFVVLGEEALHRRVGTPEIMHRQLQRLRDIADLPNVSIRVVGFDAGPQAALSCPFTLLWIERARATIAYVETLTSGDYVKSTNAYTLAFDRAQREAKSEDETRTLLDDRMAELG